MKRKLLVAVPLLFVVGLIAWLFRPKHEYLGDAYVSERSVTLWRSVAQVRDPMDTLHYGDRVDVMARRNDNVKVRTVAGEIGWLDSRSLLEAALWERSVKLLETVRGMPVQARGRTKDQTNLRVEHGRGAPRLYQFGRGVPLEIVSRAVADWVQVVDEREGANEPLQSKKEDWFLIRGVATRPPEETVRRGEVVATTRPGDQTIPIAGWAIARFVELDLPEAVHEGVVFADCVPFTVFVFISVA